MDEAREGRRDLARDLAGRLTQRAFAPATLLAAVLMASAIAEPVAFHPADAERGRALADVCLPCHGRDDAPSGTEPSFRVPRLAGQRGEAILEALLAYRSGARRSPVMQLLVAELSIQDMRDLAAFLSASGPYVPNTVGAGSRAHRQVRRDCTACHGESGMGVMAGVPVLTGQHEDYLVHALEAYRRGDRDHHAMQAIARNLTRRQIRALSAYFAKHAHLTAVDGDAKRSTASSELASPSASAVEDAPDSRAPMQIGGSDVQGPTAAAVADSIVMIDIAAGEFVMGTEADAGFQNGYPPRPVSVPAFRIGRTEVTFAQYDAFAGATGRRLPPDEAWGRGERPVIHVDRADAAAFIDWLNAGTGRSFRLPTEAEWEYAARGGTTERYWWGDDVDHGLVNNSVDEGDDVWAFTAPVDRFPPNPFGLVDVLGNVWELVADCRYSSYEGAPIDGSARSGGACESRVVRGGSWGSTARGIEVAARAAAAETFESMDVGFRLAESLPGGRAHRVHAGAAPPPP
jgi:formylglycine-generating enzyme required for sulfatase activity